MKPQQLVERYSVPPTGGRLAYWAEQGLRLVCVVYDPDAAKGDGQFLCYLEAIK